MIYRVTIIPALLLSAALVMGCTDKELQQNPEPVNVTFRVSPVSVDVEPYTKGTTSGADIGEVVNVIGYKLFKVSSLVASDEVSFDPGTEEAPAGFGTITARILPGSYQLYCYAYGAGSGEVEIKGGNNTTQIYALGTDRECFTKMMDLTVTASTGDVSITLPRTSGKLTIKISDTAPSEVAKVVYSATDYGKVFDESNHTVYQQGWTAEATITEGALADYVRHIPNPKNPTTLTISLYDSSNTLLNQITTDVPIYKNRNSIVSGKLFENLGEKDLTITIDDNWGDDYNHNL